MLKQRLQRHALTIVGAVITLLVAAATVGAAAGVGDDVLDALPGVSGSSTVEICHVPSDDPDEPETISVDEGDVEEHLAHGDTEGTCVETEPEEPEEFGPTAGTEICHVPAGNPDNAHTIYVEEGELEEHLAHGDIEGTCGETEPGSQEDLGPSDSVEVCHIPDGNTDNAHTISIGESAVQEHVDHGDTVGTCGETEPGSQEDLGPSDRVEVCHASADNLDNTHTLSLPENAAAEHLDHGDAEGPCEGETSPGGLDGPGLADRVEVCHASADNPDNTHTLSLPENAAAGHLDHGDTEGPCDEE